MTKNELQDKLLQVYPDAVFNVSNDIFNNHVVFAYIPSRDLYIDVLNIYPCMWCEDFDEDLHPDGDEEITFTDTYVNSIMQTVDWQHSDENEELQKLEHWMNYFDIPLEKLDSDNINYVVFWDEKLEDANLWFAMDCPNGKDYIREYSWIPEKDILDYPLYEFTGTPRNLSKIVKHFQFFEFFWRELGLWYNNDPYGAHGKLQGYLYANRYKYINKKPDELTTAEILRGLTISGVLRGYTTFDAKLMYEILDKYNIQSVYDPCAGWGERMLACYYKNIKYTGVDINSGLECGYSNMIEYYNMHDVSFINDDSSKYIPKCNYDSIITCPPYGNIEYYSDLGAENYSHDDFLKWWNSVVDNCCKANPTYFCFQINTKYRDDMLKIVEQAGYELIDELFFKSNKSSHFNRKKNGVNFKVEKESMLVLKAK